MSSKPATSSGGSGLNRLLLLSLAGVLVAGAIWFIGHESASGGRGLETEFGEPGDFAQAETLVQPASKVEQLAREAEQRKAVGDLAEIANEFVNGSIDVGPRGLLVRVVDQDKNSINGIPLALFVHAPPGQVSALFQELRTSGAGDYDKHLGPDHLWNPSLSGLAVWSGNEGILQNYWSALDSGRASELPLLEVGVNLPLALAGGDASKLRIALDLEQWPETAVELVLEEPLREVFRPLGVQLFFADGALAAGIEVDLYSIPLQPEFGNLAKVGSALSDGDGIAWIDRGQQLRVYSMMSQISSATGSGLGGPPYSDFFECFLTANIPMHLEKRLMLESNFGDKRLHRYELPPLGRLSATFVDEDGLPFSAGKSEFKLQLNWMTAPQPPNPRAMSKSLSRSSKESSMDLGPIGLGLELRAKAWLADRSRVAKEITVIGPDRVGEVVELKMVFGRPIKADPVADSTASREQTVTPEMLAPAKVVFASGAVLDDSGQPVGFAHVFARTGDNSRIFATSRTDAAGRFELASEEFEDFALEIHHDDFVAKYEDVRKSHALELELRMQRAGRLEGSIRPIAGLIGSPLEVVATNDGVKVSSGHVQNQFSLRGLPPGLATVRVIVEEPRFELLQIEDVVVDVGASNRDPRLVNVDLDALARVIWFQFERSANEAWVPGYVRMSIDGISYGSVDLSGRTRKQLLVPRHGQFARFELNGFRAAEVPLVGDEIAVHFEPL